MEHTHKRILDILICSLHRRFVQMICILRKAADCRLIMAISCGVIIENDKGEILLQKRRDSELWALIGGSMEIGEKFIEVVKREAFKSVHQLPYILCYNVLCDFVSLIFSLIKVCNTLWEDITANISLKNHQITIRIWRGQRK